MVPCSRPAKILYLDHAPILGGAERVLLNVFEVLDRDRFAPMVGTSADASWLGELEILGIETVALPFGRLNQFGVAMPFNLVATVAAIVRVVRQHQVAIIHSNTARAHIVATLAALITRIPLVWTLHDNTLPSSVVRLFAPIPRQVIMVSSWLQDLYGPFGLSHKTSVIYNGLKTDVPLTQVDDLRAELGVPIDAPLIVNVGRLVAGKAPHLFVQAAQIVSRMHPDAYFVLVGGPDQAESGRRPSAYPDELARIVRGSKLDNKLIVTGYRSDVDRFYVTADMLVYTSVQPEGLPTVLLEAMGYAVPVVATAIGGAEEIVQDHVTGLCVPPSDLVALADAMSSMLNDRDRARSFGQAGRVRLANEFSLEAQFSRTAQVYDRVLGRRPE